VRAGPVGAGPADGAESSDPRERLARAVRRVTDLAVGRPIDDAELAAAAAEVERLADRLAAAAGEGRRQLVVPGRQARVRDFLPASPVIGAANPIAPPAEVWSVTTEDGRRELAGRVTFGFAYEGAPGLVHGGVLAMVCDDMLGAANMMAGEPGVTAMLTVRYRKPVPVATELTLQARLVERSGRKITTWGGILVDGEVLAEGEGLFIAMKAERMLNVTGDADPAPGPE
jgi:acyl-coenzyme A thioesterase PaaI-like protein